MNNNLKMKTVLLSSIMVASIAVVPAFATINSSSGPYSTVGSVPNGWSADGHAYAQAQSGGTGLLYSTTSAGGATELSTGYWNMDVNGNMGSQPAQLTSGASPIYYGANTSYHVSITNQGSGTTWMKIGANLYEKSGSSWVFADSCINQINSSGSNALGYSTDCSRSLTIGQTYDTVGIDETFTTGPISGTNTVDAKNSGNDVVVNDLIVCDESCSV